MLGWIFAAALGVFAATRSGSSPAKLPDEDEQIPEAAVPQWRGVVGRVSWSVSTMVGVAVAWEVRIRYVPASGNLPAVTAQTLSGAEPDVGAAIRAAVRTAIEQGGSAARGVVQGSSTDGAYRFIVQPSAPGWQWNAVEMAANGRHFDGRELQRGPAVLAAIDAIGALTGGS